MTCLDAFLFAVYIFSSCLESCSHPVACNYDPSIWGAETGRFQGNEKSNYYSDVMLNHQNDELNKTLELTQPQIFCFSNRQQMNICKCSFLQKDI